MYGQLMAGGKQSVHCGGGGVVNMPPTRRDVENGVVYRKLKKDGA